jgi:hypothetical protein
MADQRYGSEILPRQPLQDMEEIDTLVGSVQDRTANPADFTGGTTGAGLGGTAIVPEEAPGPKVP